MLRRIILPGIGYLMLALILSPVQLTLAQTRIFFEDFESSGDAWKEKMRPGGAAFLSQYIARVNTNCRNGGWCIRGNAMNGRTDPVTGLAGSGMHPLQPRFGTNSSPTPDGIFLRYWRRLDHSFWASPSDHGKAEYLLDAAYAHSAFYTRQAWSATNFFLGDNGAAWINPSGSVWYTGSGRLNNSGTGVAYLQGPSVYSPTTGAADGQWHKYEFYVDYTSSPHTLRMWVDGTALTAYGLSLGHFSDRIPVHPAFRYSGSWLMYVGSDGTAGSTDGEGYACGYQFDDFEAWDGLPPGFGADSMPPAAPSNLRPN